MLKKNWQKADQESSFVLIQFQHFMATTLQQFIHSMKNHNKHVLFATVFISAKPGKVHTLKSLEI